MGKEAEEQGRQKGRKSEFQFAGERNEEVNDAF